MDAEPRVRAITDDLVRDYMARFVGYGNLDAPVWYIGMEEAGVENVEQAQRRMSVWRDFGSSTVDLREYHHLIGDFRCFQDDPEHQPTWRGLIRIHRAYRGLEADVPQVLRHQQHDWGRLDGDQALLELYPLPKRNLVAWDYHQWTTIDELLTRRRYYSALRQPRVQLLAGLIASHRPQFVVFYGKKYAKHWEAIAGATLMPSPQLPAKVIGVARGPNSTFIAIDHTSQGWRSGDLATVGKFMAEVTEH